MTHTHLKESTDMLTISLEYVQRTICTISIRIYTYEHNEFLSAASDYFAQTLYRTKINVAWTWKRQE